MLKNNDFLHKSETTERTESWEGETFDEPEEAKNEDGKDKEKKKMIGVGDSLPCGPRMYYETSDNVVRIKDIAVKKRVLLVGVLGSFTPDCWNRHLYLVLDRLDYLRQREVDHVCCVATNDPYAQRAWGAYLGCQDAVLMCADPTKRFTRAIGMDLVVPWLDDTIRSRRYVILADDLQVTKIIVAPTDHLESDWKCEHFRVSEPNEEEGEDDDEGQWL